MKSLLDGRASIHEDMIRSDPEKGLYAELPPEVLLLSNTVDEFLAETASRKPGLFYANDQVKSRSGASITLLMQNPKYHQYDVTSHLDISAWAAYHIQTALSYVVDEDILQVAMESIKDIGEVELSLAAYLHDIEKAFASVTPVDMSHPTQDLKDASPTRLLDIEDLLLLDISPAESDSVVIRQAISELILKGKAVAGTNESFLNKFNGLLAGKVNADAILLLLKAYSEVDTLVTEANVSDTSDFSVFDLRIKALVKEQTCSPYLFAGVLLELCDNYAQGVPLQKTPKFDAQQIRSTSLCNYILRFYMDALQ